MKNNSSRTCGVVIGDVSIDSYWVKAALRRHFQDASEAQRLITSQIWLLNRSGNFNLKLSAATLIQDLHKVEQRKARAEHALKEAEGLVFNDEDVCSFFTDFLKANKDLAQFVLDRTPPEFQYPINQ